MRGIFDQHVQLLHKTLDFRAKRNALLSGNIANMETPGYKAKDLVFEKALGEAMKAHLPGPLTVTDRRGSTRTVVDDVAVAPLLSVTLSTTV